MGGTEAERWLDQNMTSNGITILVIDDDDFCRQMAKGILTKKLSYEVLTAPSGMDGVDILKKNTVHLVLLDVSMPGWDGFKTLSVIRENVLLKEIPVIMLTASADRSSVIRAVQYGAADYIRKPFDPDELVNRVSKVIWEHWQEESLDALTLGIDDLFRNLGGGSDF